MNKTYRCVLCDEEVPIIDLREHAVKHNYNFMMLDWDDLIEIYEECLVGQAA